MPVRQAVLSIKVDGDQSAITFQPVRLKPERRESPHFRPALTGMVERVATALLSKVDETYMQRCSCPQVNGRNITQVGCIV